MMDILQGGGKSLPTDLDIEQPEALLAYLRGRGLVAADERPLIETLTGGVSNRTVWIERPGGGAWVLKQALAKLRVPEDWFSDPRRIHREAEGARWLAQLAPKGAVVPILFEDPKHDLLAMEAVPEPCVNWKDELLGGRIRLEHFEQFGRILGDIHERAYRRKGEIEPIFRDWAHFESLRLEPFYEFSASRVPEATGFLDTLIDETRAHRLTLTHGDFSPKNILIHKGALILLDHEVIHWGDPAFDVGFSLAHFLSKAHHLVDRRDEFAEAAERYWDVYREKVAGVDWRGELEPRAVRHALGCLLARVEGRSPLPYLHAEKRRRQREAAVGLMLQPPRCVAALIGEFLGRL